LVARYSINLHYGDQRINESKKAILIVKIVLDEKQEKMHARNLGFYFVSKILAFPAGESLFFWWTRFPWCFSLFSSDSQAGAFLHGLWNF